MFKNPFNDFLDDILARVDDVTAIRDRGLRILFDSRARLGHLRADGYSAYRAQCAVDVIHTERDAYFGGIAPAPSEHSLGELSEKVVDGGCGTGTSPWTAMAIAWASSTAAAAILRPMKFW